MWLFISNHIGIHMHLINTVSRAHADNNIIQSSSLIGQSSKRHHQTTTSSHDLCIKSLFVSQWSHQQSINISQLCLRISSLAVHRQQRSQRTKVEHRPWNDASFYLFSSLQFKSSVHDSFSIYCPSWIFFSAAYGSVMLIAVCSKISWRTLFYSSPSVFTGINMSTR